MNDSGQIKAVIFDWAGTTVDFGSLAPLAAFRAAFQDSGVPVSDDEIRGPMGHEKRQHITYMLNGGAVAAR